MTEDKVERGYVFNVTMVYDLERDEWVALDVNGDKTEFTFEDLIGDY